MCLWIDHKLVLFIFICWHKQVCTISCICWVLLYTHIQPCRTWDIPWSRLLFIYLIVTKWSFRTLIDKKQWSFIHSYTLRRLRTCCSQFELMILKIHESSAWALFLCNFTPNNLGASANNLGASAFNRVHSYARRIMSFVFWKIISCW